MKKNCLFLLLLLCLGSCGFMGSSDDKPKVVSKQVEHRTNDPIFGEITIYTLHDNRICDKNESSLENHFVVIKYEDEIYTSDICNHCHKKWSEHLKDE